MIPKPYASLSRRERQIMDVLFRLGCASAAQVRAGMPDPPSYSAVRATLRILEDKGVARHEEQKGKYIYGPAVSRDSARHSALRRLVETFFDGSAASAAAALLGSSAAHFTGAELDRLAGLVEKARKEGKS